MPSLTVKTSRLSLRPVDSNEIPPPPPRLRNPQWDNAGSMAGNTAARHGRAAAAAGGLRMMAEALNDKSIDVALKNWLKANEQKIVSEMVKTGNSVFIVSVTYTLNTWGGGRFYQFEAAGVAGYAKNLADIKSVLTPQRLYGPQMHAIYKPYIRPISVYLVGERLDAKVS